MALKTTPKNYKDKTSPEALEEFLTGGAADQAARGKEPDEKPLPQKPPSKTKQKRTPRKRGKPTAKVSSQEAAEVDDKVKVAMTVRVPERWHQRLFHFSNVHGKRPESMAAIIRMAVDEKLDQLYAERGIEEDFVYEPGRGGAVPSGRDNDA